MKAFTCILPGIEFPSVSRYHIPSWRARCHNNVKNMHKHHASGMVCFSLPVNCCYLQAALGFGSVVSVTLANPKSSTFIVPSGRTLMLRSLKVPARMAATGAFSLTRVRCRRPSRVTADSGSRDRLR